VKNRPPDRWQAKTIDLPFHAGKTKGGDMKQRFRHHRDGFPWKVFLELTGSLLLASLPLSAQPAGYYDSSTGLKGTNLQQELHAIIDGHVQISYGGLWVAFKELYEDPSDSDRLILFYTEASWEKEAQDSGFGTVEFWNREHLWPRSYNVGGSGDDFSDMFHVVPANKAVNADRSNKYFDVGNPADGNFEDPAYTGGGLDTAGLVEDFNSWEPDDPQKGWVARAMFYMATRYNHLSLGEIPSEEAGRMGKLSTLLDWNRSFLPAGKEKEANEEVFATWQFNRNPFIDYPEFADTVYLDGPSWGGWRLVHFSLAELRNGAISGDNADPDGDGLINLLERARFSDPLVPDVSPPLEFEPNESTLQLRFLRCRETGDLLASLVLEQATSLSGNWSEVPLTGADVTALNATQEEVVVTVNAPEPASPIFYRLRVERE